MITFPSYTPVDRRMTCFPGVAGYTARRKGWIERLRALVMQMATVISGAGIERRREELFTEICRTHTSLIAGICLSFAENRQDFEDLRQDVMLNVWRGISGFRRECADSTWIYRVTLNTCVSFQRKKQRRDDVSLQDLYRELYDNSTPEDIDRYRIMYALIGRLKPVDRSVMLMWLDGNGYDRIAEVVGISRDGVAARVKRSKDRLADMYKDLYD